MGKRFTHVINPFTARPGTNHDRAQAVTFASMRRAVQEAEKAGIAVEILGAVFPEDHGVVEPPVVAIAELTRCVQDITAIKPVKRLPLLADILDAAHRHGCGEYVIYTNIDISLMPDFYLVLDQMVRDAGHRDFCCTITRRTISDEFTGAEQLDAMYAAPSTGHPGSDCFVFPRRYIEQLILNRCCIGASQFSFLLMANVDALSGYRFQRYHDRHMTFHIGDDLEWLSDVHYDKFNYGEFRRGLEELARNRDYPPDSTFAEMVRLCRHFGSLKRRAIREACRIPGLARLMRRLKQRLQILT